MPWRNLGDYSRSSRLPYRWWSMGFAFPFLNELFSPRRRHVAGASTVGAGLATERQAAPHVAFALTDRALSERHLSHRLVSPNLRRAPSEAITCRGKGIGPSHARVFADYGYGLGARLCADAACQASMFFETRELAS
jgi:hypothetical protein